MLHKTIYGIASMGFVAFGFLCFMQGNFILTELNNIACLDVDNCFTSLWIVDLGILVLTAVASTLCFCIAIMEGQRYET
jgi:hypothetical protein